MSLLANRNYKPDVVVRAYRPGTQEVGDEGFQAILDYKVGWSPGWIMRSCLQNNHSKNEVVVRNSNNRNDRYFSNTSCVSVWTGAQRLSPVEVQRREVSCWVSHSQEREEQK